MYIILVLYQRVFKDDIFGYRVYTISSGSMEPTYEVGDVVLIKKTPAEDLKVGDVITYEIGNITVTHRLVSITEGADNIERYTTKGDANEVNDPSFAYDRIEGKLVYRFKLYSLMVKLVHNKVTFFFIIFVPLVVTIFLDIADDITYKREVKEGE